MEDNIIIKDLKAIAPVIWFTIKMIGTGVWLVVKGLGPLMFVGYMLFPAPDLVKVAGFIMFWSWYWGKLE